MRDANLATEPRVEIAGKVEQLIDVLMEELKTARRVASFARQRVVASERGHLTVALQSVELQREALFGFVLAERERVALLTEIGLILELKEPSTLRIAHLILYVTPELRDELLDVREDLRDVADELDELRAWSGSFEHCAVGSISVFLAPEISDEESKRWLIEGLRRTSAVRDGGSDFEEDVEPTLNELGDDC